MPLYHLYIFFFFNDTATTEIYTLSLHDALPIFTTVRWRCAATPAAPPTAAPTDRKSTRLNSSHGSISYAVFCLKKKTKPQNTHEFLQKITENIHNEQRQI